MHRTTLLFATTFMLIGGASLASGDSVDYEPREAHAKADKNGDGQVDRLEFHIRMVEIFYHDDADKDGFLVPKELEKINEEVVFEPADRNRDGKLTMSEYIDQRFEAFEEADVNSDGGLSVQEVIDAWEGP